MSHSWWTSQENTSRHPTLAIHSTTITVLAINSSTHSLNGSRALTPVTLFLNHLSLLILVLTLLCTPLLHNSTKPSCTPRTSPSASENPLAYCVDHLSLHGVSHPSTPAPVPIHSITFLKVNQDPDPPSDFDTDRYNVWSKIVVSLKGEIHRQINRVINTSVDQYMADYQKGPSRRNRLHNGKVLECMWYPRA